MTRALSGRLGPDFAGLDGRKTGSWEEGGQQGFSLMSSEEFVEHFHQKEIKLVVLPLVGAQCRVGPDFAERDGRKTGSWEEGSQQGTPDRCAPFQIVVRARNLKLPLATALTWGLAMSN